PVAGVRGSDPLGAGARLREPRPGDELSGAVTERHADRLRRAMGLLPRGEPGGREERRPGGGQRIPFARDGAEVRDGRARLAVEGVAQTGQERSAPIRSSGMHALAIVVVSTNEARWLEPCLRTVREHAGPIDLDVVVADNGSSDGTPEVAARVPGARV